MGYYIYNLAKSSEAEDAVSQKVYAMGNYWGGSDGRPAGDNAYFYPPGNHAMTGPIVWYPYVSEYLITGDIGAQGTPLTKIVSDNKMIALQAEFDSLKNEIITKPADAQNARRLIRLYYLQMDDDPQDNLKEKTTINQFISEKRNILENMYRRIKNDTTKISRAIKITGEVAMILEIDRLIQLKEYDEAIILANKYDPYIQNTDNRRELYLKKITILENLGEYLHALAVLQLLNEEVKVDQQAIEGYIPPNYIYLESSLKEALGIGLDESVPGIEGYLKKELLIKEEIIPEKFALLQNYPNPFNPITSIPFDLPEASHVKIEIYNILGQKMVELTDKIYEPGTHIITFNADHLATGMYIVRAIINSKQIPYNSYVFMKKMMIIK